MPSAETNNFPAGVPLALGLAILATGLWLLWRIGPGNRPLHLRVSAVAVLACAMATAGVRLLAALNLLTPPGLLVTGGSVCAVLGVVARFRRTPGIPWRARLPPFVSRESLAPLILSATVVTLAAFSAVWLPVWQWDSLGYHLPFVNLLIQSHGLQSVPRDLPYLSTYPHGVEYLFTALRLLLPDDRLVDLGQIPFGILGAVATTALARIASAQPARALSAGALWLTLPAVFLQLPTNYVDVAAAAYLLLACVWFLAPPTTETVLLFGLALGLFVGAKPTAPVGATILAIAMAVRSTRAGLARWLPVAALATVILGAETYVFNIVRHGNPVWPVAMNLGVLHLPGRYTVHTLLAAGAMAPRPVGSLPVRVLTSWLALDAIPMFDMRRGGFGPLFVGLALPAAMVAMVRGRRWLWAVAMTAAVAVPEPSTARYTLALPALCLALTAALATVPPGDRRVGVVLALATVFAVWALCRALPGLTGDGPPLSTYARLSPAARARSVSPDGHPGRWLDFQQTLGPGDVVVLDETTRLLPYRLWRSNLENRVTWLDPTGDRRALAAEVRGAGATYAVFSSGTPGDALATSLPGGFRPVFGCPDGECTVYAVGRGPW